LIRGNRAVRANKKDSHKDIYSPLGHGANHDNP
jgi:hypothetical protein